MSHSNELAMLGSLVESAESQRTFQHTTALQSYLDQHPDLSDMTLSMTADIRQKLLMYIANADPKTQASLQAELDALQSHLAYLSEQPTVLHRLLAEEVLTSYLMLRCADTAYARHQGSLTTMALRRADSAQIRFLRAIKTLAQIHQRLPQKIVNVNLGQQIVNH